MINWPTERATNRSTDWPTDRLTNQSIHPSIYLSIYIYIHIYISSFTTGSIVDKSMKRKNMFLLKKPGSILLKDKNTKQKMILVVEKLAITLYGPLWRLVPFSKMIRQRIKTNYCLKDLVTFWMTKAQKIWICCLKQLGSILLNRKNKYEILMDPHFWQ